MPDTLLITESDTGELYHIPAKVETRLCPSKTHRFVHKTETHPLIV